MIKTCFEHPQTIIDSFFQGQHRCGLLISVILALCLISNGGVEAESAKLPIKPPQASKSTLPRKPAELREAKGRADDSILLTSNLERISIELNGSDSIKISELPRFQSIFLNRVAGISRGNHFVFYSLDPKLQKSTDSLVRETKAPHVAVVLIEPSTGKLLAVSSKSTSISNLALHANFPAASLFKVITAAAAYEQGAINPNSTVFFRGGDYTLDLSNYLPNPKKDNRFMTVAEAMGKSCNPVFGRIALKFIEPQVLKRYAGLFGFNSRIDFDIPLDTSTARIPSSPYELSRTAAGFGDVRISPIHAATLMAGIANHGLMPRPALVDKVITASGEVLYDSRTEIVRRVSSPTTAQALLEMMSYTTTIGTSRKEFIYRGKPLIPGVRVAAKTGTLRGNDPKGINNWFIATAPLDKPEIAMAVVVVNPGGISSRASHIGRQILQDYFRSRHS